LKNQRFTREELTVENKKGYSLILSLSHLSLIFPLEIQNISADGKTGSFCFKKECSSYPLQEWYDLFQSTASYRIQQVILGEEASPFIAAVELIDKKITQGKLELEFYFHQESLKQH